MAENRAHNIAIKQGLDTFLSKQGEDDVDPKSVFSAPVESDDDLFARGLLDPTTGDPTSKGLLFSDLKDAGMFDERGAMTPKAHAYAMDYAEVVSGGERTLDAYKARMEDGIDNPDVSWDKTLGAVGEYAWDMAAGFGTMVKLVNKEVFSFGESAEEIKKREAETSAAMTAGMEGAMKANFELAGMMGVANAHLVNEWFYDAPEQEREKRVWMARQQRDKISYDNQAAKIGETLESFLPVDGVTEQMAADKQTLGKPVFDQTVKQGDAIGQMGTVDAIAGPLLSLKAATTVAKTSRIALTAERILGQRAAAATRLAAKELEHASAVRIAGAAEKTAAQAQRTAGSLAARFEATGDQVLGQGARRAGEIAAEHGAIAARSTAAAAEAAAEVERLSAQAAKLTTLIPEKAAQKFLQTVELGRKIKAMPATALGATLEQLGNGLSRGDAAITGFLKERGLDQLYTGAVGAAGMLGLAGNPVLGVVGAGAGVLKTGKLIESYGKLLRYVGKEMTQARGQIPFWQRVAAHTAPGSMNRGLAHTFGMFELGGATSDVIRRTGRGIMAAAPADLAFEWLADDGDISANTFKQGFAESLVIGGSFAAGGGAFMGTKRRMRELAVNDQLNFMKGLVEPRQKALFNAIPHESQRAIATYSIANPTLNFNFTDGGASHYDPPTNTATINITSTNPLKALLGHEVLHHTVIKNNMESGIAALFLGDTKGDGNGNFVTGGLLRSKDGTLDPNFGEFVETYNRRMDRAGAERPGLDALAVEYFIEQHSDQYSDMAESGALGALAARGSVRRGMGSILDAVLPRTPVLKDLHFKMGGVMDGNGAMVTGNGLLGFGGIRQLPASNRMFRDMNRRSSGRVPGQFEPLGTDRPDGGASITLNPASSIDLGLMHPMIVVNDAGNPVLQGGKPVFIDKATDVLRGAAGITVMERLRENKAAGKKYAPGELHLDDNGEVQGRWLSPDTLREVIAKNKFNPEQAQVMRSVNAAIKTGDGSRMVVINFPATKKLKNGKTVYAPQAATIRDIVPVGLTITKDGNLLIGLMSVTKLTENIQKRAGSKRGKRLYGGNTDLILQDVRSMMDYHKRGEDSIGHFRDKYGAVEADERKKFINTMFGLLNKSEQAVLNPLLLEDGVTSKDNVYRTYRVDRVSKAVPMDPDQHKPMPFSYEAASAVKMPGMPSMPDGARMLPEPGAPPKTPWKEPETGYLPRRDIPAKKDVEVSNDGTIKFKGKEPKDWSPQDFEEFGKRHGVENLGPLSKVESIPGELGGSVAKIPGGLEGKFTYYDMLWLKSHPVDVAKMPVNTHAQLTAKLARTMTPSNSDKAHVFNGLMIGFLSPNAPLLPNEFGQARMRFGSLEEIRKFSELLPENPTKDQRTRVNEKLKKELGISSAAAGGLGLSITADLSNIVLAAQKYIKDPAFFRKRSNESWADYVDKMTTQLSGLGTKTASFGGVWQDPLNAAISAMDRHMARLFGDELMTNPEMRKRFDKAIVGKYNQLLLDARKIRKSYDGKISRSTDPKRTAKLEREKKSELADLPDPSAVRARTLDDVLGQVDVFGEDNVRKFVNEAAFSAMGSRKGKFLTKSGEISKSVPASIRDVQWVETPKDFQVMSDTYRAALEMNEQRAKSMGIEIFPAQWTLWDRIRGRVEPHEAMFPGLEKIPALNDRQLGEAYTANKQAGYSATPKPGKKWNRQEGVEPARLAYFMPEPLDGGGKNRGMTREEFLGKPRITTNANAADLKPKAVRGMAEQPAEPFAVGGFTARYHDGDAAVYDGDKVIASFNFGDTLTVDPKYRRRGIAEELVYQVRTRNPNVPPAAERTKVAQKIEEKVWERIQREQSKP